MAMDYQNFATLGVNLNRQKYGPLDVSSVFTSTADLKYYISKGSIKESGLSNYWKNTIPYPYEGQIVALNENGKVNVFKIILKDGALDYEDISAEVQKDLNQFRTETGSNIVNLATRMTTVENAINNLPVSPDLTGYATEGYVNSVVESAEENLKSELYGEVEILNGSISALEADLTNFVPKSRTINGYNLSNNITLLAKDVEADPEGSAAEALNEAKKYTEEYAVPRTMKLNGQTYNPGLDNYSIEASHIPLTNQDDTNAEKLNVETYLKYLDRIINNITLDGNFLPSTTTINGNTFDGDSSYLAPNFTIVANNIPAFDSGATVLDYLNASICNITPTDDGQGFTFYKNNQDLNLYPPTEIKLYGDFPLKKSKSGAIGAIRMETAKTEGMEDLDDITSVYNMPEGAMAIGKDTKTYGKYSFASGYKSVTGQQSVQPNGSINYYGDYSFAAGEEVAARGKGSFAIGYNTSAEGEYSLAEGYQTEAKATAPFSHAEGLGTIAAASYQHVQGKYNVADANGNYVHIVGHGLDNDNRANIHTLNYTGDAWFKGNVMVGDDNKKLTTEDYVNTNMVPNTRKINNQTLDKDLILTYTDVGADAAGSSTTAEDNAKAYADGKFLPKTATVNGQSFNNGNATISFNAYQIRSLEDNQPDSAIDANKLSVGLYLRALDSEIQDLQAKTENSAYITQDQIFINGMAWGGVGSGGKEDSFTLTGENIKATIQKAPVSSSTETFPINKSITELLGGSFRKVSLNELNRRFIFESWDGSYQSVEIPGASLSNLLNGEHNEGAVKMTTSCQEGQTIDGQFDENYMLGPASMTIGRKTRASGEASLAIGVNTEAGTYKRTNGIISPSGIGILAAGIGTSAVRDGSAVFGTYNQPGNYIFSVGNGFIKDGSTSPIKQNAFTIDASGNAWFAGRIQIGKNIEQEQSGNTGWNSNDTAGAATLITRFEMEDYVENTVNKPLLNLVNISDGTKPGSIYTSTSKTYKNDLGEGSVIFGTDTKASNYNGFAIGQNSTASGQQSFAQGYYTVASGTNATAFGYFTEARGMEQFVCGSANIIDENNLYTFIVGNGENATKRSNGFTVDWEGNGEFAGEVSVGANKTKLIKEGEQDFIINITPGETDADLTSDKTFAETKEAYDKGYNIVARVNTEMFQLTCQTAVYVSEAEESAFVFTSSIFEDGSLIILMFLNNDTWVTQTEPFMSSLTFTGAVNGTYNGTSPLTVNIPTPQVNKTLTFTGAVNATYDGSYYLNVKIPETIFDTVDTEYGISVMGPVGCYSTDAAYGGMSFTWGPSAGAFGYASFATGYKAITHADYSFVAGFNATVPDGANYSFAMGQGATVAMDTSNAFSFGYGTNANTSGQFACGAYNKSVTGAHFIVGKGGSASSRSNSLVLDKDNNLQIAGTSIILKSSTTGSSKYFKLTVTDDGIVSATKVSSTNL